MFPGGSTPGCILFWQFRGIRKAIRRGAGIQSRPLMSTAMVRFGSMRWE